MFAGPPAAGKTTAALIMAIRSGATCLYISADSDDLTMAARTTSAVTGHLYRSVREAQANGVFTELYGEELAQLPIRFVFDPSEPSVEDIENALIAYYEIFSEYPELLVIDNLMNMVNEDGNEWQGMRATVKDLHYLARKTKACIWLLHHTSEQVSEWVTKAPPRSAIQGKLSQLPEVILTMATDPVEGLFWMAVVKNRHGPQDPHAKDPVRMVMDFATIRLYDERMMGGVYG